jgi:hypothetical protein
MGHKYSKNGKGAEKANMNQEWMPIPTQMNAPPPGYRPGIDPEWNYGIGNPQSATALRAYNASLPQNARAAEAYAPKEKSSGMNSAEQAFWDRINSGEGGPGNDGPAEPTGGYGYGRSGTGGGGADSGQAANRTGLAGLLGNAASAVRSGVSGVGDRIGSSISNLGNSISKFSTTGKFAEGGQVDPQAMDQGTGIAALQAKTEPAPVAGNEKDLISQAVSAIKGEVDDPRPVLAAFVQKYGEDALRNLVDKIHSGEMDQTAQRSEGHLKGPGDGMSDMIPASVDGNSDVLLSDGEYVVPADVVSGLGNGSSDAGAKHLDEMMARVRQQRTGTTEQAKQINAKDALPKMSHGGRVPKYDDEGYKYMTKKSHGEYSKADRNKMPVYGDDINEPGKPKFNTPVFDYSYYPNDLEKTWGRGS